jgi:molybdate transport system substrate-binding protein
MRWSMNVWWKLSSRGQDIGQPTRIWRHSLAIVAAILISSLLAISGRAAVSDARRIQSELTIFTAASLTDAFKEMAASIEQANPGTKLTFNFAGSPTLRTQLAQGARADAFASADEPNMYAAERDGTITGEPRIFVHNRLVVVPANNLAGIKTLQDLAKPKIKLVLTNKDVPVGNYARQALEKMSQDPAFGSAFPKRVLANLMSEETNAKQVASKGQLGEADAGIIYSTDVTPAIRLAVKVLDLPPEFNIIAKYPIAVVKGTRNEVGARTFIEYVLSPAGQSLLERYGFLVAGS